MTTEESKDWRDPLCRKLAQLADSVKSDFNDRTFVIQTLYRLAEAERTAPVEQRIGALRAVEKANPKSLTQIFTKTKKFREVIPVQDYVPPEVSTTVEPAVKQNPVSVPQNKPSIATTDAPLDYVYGMLLDSDYPVDSVQSTLSQFVMQSVKEPGKAEVTGCAKAGLRHDLRVCQNVPAFSILTILASIPWIKDVVAKPPVLFGEVFIATD